VGTGESGQIVNIKNYTSGIPVESTISRIEAKLAAAGASGIMKLYGPDKRVCALVFEIELPGRPRPMQIRVPANAQACFEAMWKSHCQTHSHQLEAAKVRIRDQAVRTAWKLVQDWIEVQISMILMKQAEFIEVFMPYLWDGKQTFFESVKHGGFKALPERCD
jgi:hypothetical protein